MEEESGKKYKSLDKQAIDHLYSLKNKLMKLRYHRNTLKTDKEILMKKMASIEKVFNQYKEVANVLAIEKYGMGKYLNDIKKLYKRPVTNPNDPLLFMGSGIFGSTIENHIAKMDTLINSLIKTINKNYYSKTPFTWLETRIFFFRNMNLNDNKNKLFNHLKKKYFIPNTGGLYNKKTTKKTTKKRTPKHSSPKLSKKNVKH